MDSSSQCHKHHHHHHHRHHCHYHHRVLPHCPIHCSQLNKLSPNSGHFPPFSQLNFRQDANFKVSNFQQAATEDSKECLKINLTKSSRLISEGDEQGLEAENELEYAFVLTDEWKEFFAKSEAKRRLAKKQEKKKTGN